MQDLISRQAAISAICNACGKIDCDKMDKCEKLQLPPANCSEFPNNCEVKICDTCRYYNSNIPCGSTPSACKEADKFAEEFVEGLKKLKPTISKMEQVDKDTNVRSKDEPTTQTETQNSNLTFEKADEPQTEREGE